MQRLTKIEAVLTRSLFLAAGRVALRDVSAVPLVVLLCRVEDLIALSAEFVGVAKESGEVELRDASHRTSEVDFLLHLFPSRMLKMVSGAASSPNTEW